ncbi:MAG: SDR family oxidoreductase [Dehalococcoidales bacterium]|nr:SDR family oxidoreductase [Dehalococcoidales bacterium]
MRSSLHRKVLIPVRMDSELANACYACISDLNKERYEMRLKKRVAVVTGARRGLGRAIALGLAREGADCAICDVDADDCAEVKREIEAAGGKGLAFCCDVTKREEVDSMIRKTVEVFGKLDILVNNAARADFKPFMRLKDDDWDAVMDANLKGQFICAQAAARAMIKNRWGRIINIASISSGFGNAFPLMSHYTASKGGVIGLTRALALELAPYDINVNAVCPGAIDTGLIPKEMTQRMVARIPKGRLGRPEEVANLVVFLASQESEYMTGSALVIDGGWLSG